MPLNDAYILDENNRPVPCHDLAEWGRFMENTKRRRVALDVFACEPEPIKVSTVFLGLDYNYRSEAGPVFWETMVFNGPMDREQDRCSGTFEDAQAMHQRMVERVRNLQKQ